MFTFFINEKHFENFNKASSFFIVCIKILIFIVFSQLLSESYSSHNNKIGVLPPLVSMFSLSLSIKGFGLHSLCFEFP